MIQGKRQRVYVLTTFLQDDNGDEVEGTLRILAGTSSLKVGEAAVETFKKYRNGQVTMVHEPNCERVFPSKIQEILETEDKAPESVDTLLKLVRLE
jgi:hypothetical protein